MLFDASRTLEHAIVRSGGTDNTYTIDAFVAAWLLESVSDSSTSVVFQHNEAGSGPIMVAPSLLHRRLGLTQGDWLQAINGVALARPQAVQELTSKLDRRIDIELVRDGVTIVMDYRVQPGLAWDRLRGAVADTVSGIPLSDSERHHPEEQSLHGFARGSAAPRSSGAALPPSYTPSPVPTRPSAHPGSPSGSRSDTTRSPLQPRPSEKTPMPSSADGSSAMGGCTSPSDCTLERSYLERMLANPERMEREARIVPAIRNDVHSGYKLYDIRPGTALDRLGFKNGDKITHVNGQFIADDAQALSLYSSLGSVKTLDIRLERNGRPMRKSIRLT